MTTESNSAIAERQKKRERKLTNAKKNAITLLKQKIKISDLVSSNQPQTEFNNLWTEFDKTLKQKHECKNHIVYAQAYNHALKTTQEEIEKYALDITFPKYIILEKRANLFRTPDWFQDAKRTREFYKKWMNQFEESNKKISKYDVFLSLTLHSGILQSITLKSIFDALNTNKLQIESLFGLLL